MTRQNNTNTTLVRRPNETLSRWDPWNEAFQMRQQMDELFGRVFGYTPLSRLIPTTSGNTLNGDFGLTPDLFETNDELVFVAPVPGIEPGELNIEATADMLSICGERKPFYVNENAKRHSQSYWSAMQGAFNVAFTLPVEIDPARIQAHYRNGVLELHLPKAQSAKPVAIKVSVDTDVPSK